MVFTGSLIKQTVNGMVINNVKGKAKLSLIAADNPNSIKKLPYRLSLQHTQVFTCFYKSIYGFVEMVTLMPG